MVLVENEQTRLDLIKLSRRLDPGWQDFFDTIAFVKGTQFVSGYREMVAICRNLENSIDLLIENMRTAGVGEVRRVNGRLGPVLVNSEMHI